MTRAKQLVTNIRIDDQAGIILPLSYDENKNPMVKLELLHSAGPKQNSAGESIRRYNEDMLNTLLSGFIQFGQTPRGSRSLHMSATQIFSLAISAFMDSVAAVINRIALPRLMSLNSMDLDYAPKLQAGEIGVRDLKELGDYVASLSQSGLTFFDKPTSDYLRKTGGLPATPEEPEVGEVPPMTPDPYATYVQEPPGAAGAAGNGAGRAGGKDLETPAEPGKPVSTPPPTTENLHKYSEDQPRDERGRFGSGGAAAATAPAAGLAPGKSIPVGQIPQMKDVQLSSEQRAVEDRFRAQMAADPEAMKAEYRRQFGNRLSSDDAKKLSEDYRKDPNAYAAAVHEPSSWITKQMYAEDLKSPVPEGKDNSVFFTAGAPGAGKTSGLEASEEMQAVSDKAHIVYDSTLSSRSTAERAIDAALDRGKNVVVMYVHRPPMNAMNGVVTRSKGGQERAVPLDLFAKSHAEIRDTMQAVAEKYQDNPRFRMVVIDNSGGKGEAKVSSLNALPKSDSEEEISRKVGAALTERYKAGDPKVNEKVYRAIMTHKKSPSGLWM
jgi:hypothetical protein